MQKCIRAQWQWMLEIKSEDLFDYVGEPMGLTKFISDVNEGQIWSF